MEFEKMKINDLLPADYNPRKELKPGDKEYESLYKSVKEFGYVDPIIVNKRTGNIVGGHQRLNVLQELGYEEIDVVNVDLDETREKALNIALNKISGKWDEPKLKDLLLDIDNGEFDVELTGFGMDEIEKLMNKFAVEEEERPELEFTPELLEEHNYIVLYFDNELDWQVAKEKFGIKTMAARWKDDSEENKRKRKGVGRVVKGANVLEMLQ